MLASTRDALVAIFPNAIAVGSPVAKGKSMAGWGGMMAAGFGLGSMVYATILAFTGTPNPMMATLAIMFGLFFLLCFTWSFRRLFMSVSDWPIVFNRKTRQITYLPAFIMPFLKFWRSPPQEWHTVSWEEVRVRTYKHMKTNAGKSFHDSYNLFLLWGGEGSENHAMNGYVSIGNEGYFEDETLWMLWEHVRRYMEEDGPAIPHGEGLRPKTRGKPIIYPPELIAAAGGPAFSPEVVAKLAEG